MATRKSCWFVSEILLFIINLLFTPCSIKSAVKVLEPVPPRAIGNIPEDIFAAFILVILVPTPVILVADKVLVSLFQDKLAVCKGEFVPFPTTNKLGTKVLNPVPPLVTDNIPFVSVDKLIRLANEEAPDPPLAIGKISLVSVDKLIKLANEETPVPPLTTGNIPLVCVDKLIKLSKLFAPVPPLTIGNTPFIEVPDKFISAEPELNTIPPSETVFKETELPLNEIPFPAVISVFVNRLNSIGSVFNVVILLMLIKPEFLLSMPFLIKI